MRLTLLAHAETRRTRDAVFGDTSDLGADPRVKPWPATRLACFSAPEPACRQTAELLGLGAARVLAGLAGPDLGRWAGRALTEVLGDDPTGVSAWLADPDASPHGGESLSALMLRVGDCLDTQPWPAAGAVVVVSPLVVRAALAHALGAQAAVMLRAEVAPRGAMAVSRHAGTWRLRSLTRA